MGASKQKAKKNKVQQSEAVNNEPCHGNEHDQTGNSTEEPEIRQGASDNLENHDAEARQTTPIGLNVARRRRRLTA